MKYEIKCAESEQKSLFYSDSKSAAWKACVGLLRMDFGTGSEFYSSWWANRYDLNDQKFSDELDSVINELRKGGLLKNRRNMQRYCADHQSLNLDESYGFSVETDDNLFLLRCRPERGYYDCYCYCYNKRELQLVQPQDQSESQSPKMSL